MRRDSAWQHYLTAKRFNSSLGTSTNIFHLKSNGSALKDLFWCLKQERQKSIQAKHDRRYL